MGLRIRTNVESLTAQRQLSNNQNDLSTSMERLSSGQRINKSADDAAGLAISENLRAKIRGLNQAKRNANDGVSLVQVAESGLNEMSNLMVRMRELTVQAASDTIGPTERGYLDKEFKELHSELDRISKSTEFNGNHLLGPRNGSIIVQVGYNGTEEDTLNLKLGEMQDGVNVESLGLKDASLAKENREEIASNLGMLDGGLQIIANLRATMGATQSRLNTSINSISMSMENQAAANSRIRDVDFAEETAKMTQSKILSQAGMAVLSQANIRPEMALSLLRG